MSGWRALRECQGGEPRMKGEAESLDGVPGRRALSDYHGGEPGRGVRREP